INSFRVNDATLNMYSTKNHPSFNFDFLTTAFADTSNQAQTDTLSDQGWVFNLNKVYLRNFRLTYNDNYAGMNVYVAIGNSEVKVDKIDLNKSIYAIDKLFLEGLTANVRQVETTNIQKNNTGIKLPELSAKKLQINNALVSYIDSPGCLSVLTNIDQSEMKNVLIDLNEEFLTADDIFMSESEISYHNFKPAITDDSNPVNSSSENNWTVTVNKLKFNDNSFSYKVGDAPALKDEFDPDNLDFKQMNLTASGFYYSSELTKISVQKFSAINQNDFVINSLSTDYSMDEHSIVTKNLKITTPYSTIDADFSIQFQSLDAFVKTYQFSDLNLFMRNVTFKNSDVLYFSRTLSEQPFFQNNTNTTTITGKVNGPMKRLTGEKLVIKTGKNTRLKTDFNITGLPEMSTAIFDFHNLTIHSVKKDLKMAESFIPEDIQLPGNIDLQLAFKGTTKSFNTTATMSSSFGDASLSASIDTDENFNGTVSLKQLDLGQLLNDSLFYGPVSLTANATGQGLDLETMKGKIKAEATQLFINQYNYHNLVLDGTVDGKQFVGTVNLDDENAVFDFDGVVNLTSGHEKFNFKLNMLGADLQKLHFADKDVRMSFVAEADLQGGSVNEMNGTAGISNIVVVSENKTYQLESLLAVSVNEPDKSELSISSALIGMKYAGNISPLALPDVLTGFINSYFPVSDSISPTTKSEQSKFNFDIQLHNHPILSDLLLPGLNEFIPGSITGSFDSEMNKLKLDATIRKMVYGTTEIEDFTIAVNSDMTALNYHISTQNISNAQMSLSNLLIDGKLE
ncbi:MAG: hypothetical protein PF486_09630, partial [Prolixibacteraceae bacterium]|nr:hypothetical protein [Prolixibacteraceae bacterium]